LRLLYNFFIFLLLPIVVIRLLRRAMRSPTYLARMGERFGRYKTPAKKYDIWIHAVSVGEVNAAGPIARALLREHPEKRILLTTMTPTGADQARGSLGNRIDHLFLPWDYPFAVKAFLNHTQPKLAIMMETEIWPNFVSYCKKRNIPLVIANLRLSERSYKKYRKLLPFARSVFRKVSHFAVQTEADKQRVQQLTRLDENITVTGNIKFEVNLPASLREVAQVVRRDWGIDRTVWVAGSTHDMEEEILLKVFKTLKQKYPKLLLVLVPRHPERFEAVFRVIQRQKLNCHRRSMGSAGSPDQVDVYLGDTMGELPTFYAAADIAFVGGSLVEIGGHNILEACALGKPVIFGPYMFNFLEISKLALAQNAGIQVHDADELISVMYRMIDDANYRYSYGENGIKLVNENRGSLQNTLDALKNYIND
jgi:3-deoxy-D-manno-octulosonic-acid transferase